MDVGIYRNIESNERIWALPRTKHSLSDCAVEHIHISTLLIHNGMHEIIL